MKEVLQRCNDPRCSAYRQCHHHLLFFPVSFRYVRRALGCYGGLKGRYAGSGSRLDWRSRYAPAILARSACRYSAAHPGTTGKSRLLILRSRPLREHLGLISTLGLPSRHSSRATKAMRSFNRDKLSVLALALSPQFPIASQGVHAANTGATKQDNKRRFVISREQWQDECSVPTGEVRDDAVPQESTKK